MNDVSAALQALAAHQRAHADYGFVVALPKVLDGDEMKRRAAEVRRISDEIDALAAEAEARFVSYDEFNSLRQQYQDLGKLPPGELVSKVARAIAAAEAAR